VGGLAAVPPDVVTALALADASMRHHGVTSSSIGFNVFLGFLAC